MVTAKVFCVIPRNLNFPPTRADGVRVFEQCRSLSKAGFEVHLIYFGSTMNSSFTAIPLNIRFYPIQGEVSVSYLNFWGMLRLFLNYCVFLFRLIGYIKTHLSTINKAVIHAHTPEGGVIGAILKFLLKLPLIYDPHDWYYEDWITEWIRMRKFIQGILCLTYRTLAVLLPIISDVTLVLNDFMLKKMGPTRKVIVPNYFMEENTVESKKSLSTIPGLIVFVGSIVRWQGVGLLLKAFSSIQKEKEDVSLWLVGDGEDIDHYKHLSSILKLRNVKFLGKVSRKEALKIISQADVCVVPFLPKRFCLTACPLKVLEYMSRHKKIVAADLPGIREILHNYNKAFFFQAGNEKALSHAIQDALSTKIDEDSPSTIERLRNTAIRNLLATYQYILGA